MYFIAKLYNIILESNGFYTQVQTGTGCFEVIGTQNVLISGLVYSDDNNHLISPEPPTYCEVNIDDEWISDNEIYRIFSENNINFSNPYCTIQKILIRDKGILFYFNIDLHENRFKIILLALLNGS